MHLLAPLLVTSLLAPADLPAPDQARVPAAAPVRAAAAPAPTLRLPRAAVQAALTSALEERGHLRHFQLGTSKFSGGRARLDDLRLLPSTRTGVARFELHGALDYARRQLGVKWRGLKSHKKWYDRGRKDVARVRVTGEARLVHRAGEPTALVLASLRVKLESRLTPARGLTARFDLDDRRFEVPDGIGALLLDRLVIERSEPAAIVLRPRADERP
ncbi:MAG: hypothetical protein AAFP86_00080 [Planctomycetota bacterium]